MSSKPPESAYVGTIRCQCGGRMEADDSRTKATSEGILYTVECLECREVGGYNSGTLEVYGAVDELEIIGE